MRVLHACKGLCQSADAVSSHVQAEAELLLTLHLPLRYLRSLHS